MTTRRITRTFFFAWMFAWSLAILPVHAQSVRENARNLNIGFNGPSSQFPYADQFFSATNDYYHSINRPSMPGDRHCHAYLSWDIAEQPKGSGPVAVEGSRAWFEAWLSSAEGQCDRALITFKYVAGVTVNSPNTYPEAHEYGRAMKKFIRTDWSYTHWTGAFDYTPWNEPNNGAGTGDGLSSTPIPPERAALYYLALRAECRDNGCNGQVAAGDFGSNGNLGVDFVQNCADDLAPKLCANASYMDQYKHWLVYDAPRFGFRTSFRPEVFAYHGWDDINDYINDGTLCSQSSKCTIRAFYHALSGSSWSSSILWDTEVGAGQYTESNPNPTVQACAASYLLRLTAATSPRFTRIYYTKPDMSDGEYWSLFDSSGNIKPAFTVLADRDIHYTPTDGSSCPQ